MTGGTPLHLPPVPSEAFVNKKDKEGRSGTCSKMDREESHIEDKNL